MDPLPQASNHERHHPGTGQLMEPVHCTPDDTLSDYLVGEHGPEPVPVIQGEHGPEIDWPRLLNG